MIYILAALLCGLAIAGWLLRQKARRGLQSLRLPDGKVVYADAGLMERPLFSPRYGLRGKPDYLIEQGGYKIPVELKSSPAPCSPYLSHMLQLAAYCLLIEEEYGHPPPYGLIQYQDASFTVDYTPALKERLLSTLEEMRAACAADDVLPNHRSPSRCRGCGFREECGQALSTNPPAGF
ncbi:MAG: CRISPR-associated protein Cas4 [Anaerolineae bacterium]